VVAYNYSLDFWVSYKLFGGMGLTMFYMACTVVYLIKGGYLNESPAANEVNDTKPAFSKDVTDR